MHKVSSPLNIKSNISFLFQFCQVIFQHGGLLGRIYGIISFFYMICVRSWGVSGAGVFILFFCGDFLFRPSR